MEDVTSGLGDSMDKGVGWDAMDGPISDFSAKGVTGNQLPNSNEMGGRSGEGRSGNEIERRLRPYQHARLHEMKRATSTSTAASRLSSHSGGNEFKLNPVNFRFSISITAL